MDSMPAYEFYKDLLYGSTQAILVQEAHHNLVCVPVTQYSKWETPNEIHFKVMKNKC